jgi:drug/metabolite transporter (DMT)-like permease
VHIEPANSYTPSKPAIAGAIGLITLVWAINFIAAKIGLRSLPSLAMASFRVVGASVAMVPIYLLALRLPAFSEARAALGRGFNWRDAWTFLYLGFFAVCVNQMCFTIGLSYTSVGHASVIVGLGPVYALVLAVLFRLETASWQKILGMAISLAGVAIMSVGGRGSGHTASLLGDAITMSGSLGFAVYLVLGKRVAQRYDALTMTAFNHFVGGLLVLPLALHELRMLRDAGTLRATPWAALTYMAIFSSALAYVFYFWLLRYLEASQLSAFAYLLPVVATMLGILYLGEKGSWAQVVGGVFALAGVYCIEMARGR